MINDHPSAEVDYLLNRLEPLARGYPVALAMLGRKNPVTKFRRPTNDRLIALAPGSMYGFRNGTILVSILGSGSCIVSPEKPKEKRSIADLVLAGMPASAATILMEKLHRLFQENERWQQHVEA